MSRTPRAGRVLVTRATGDAGGHAARAALRPLLAPPPAAVRRMRRPLADPDVLPRKAMAMLGGSPRLPLEEGMRGIAAAPSSA